ncbi:MAG: SseB family protein [Lachnospira sp.]
MDATRAQDLTRHILKDEDKGVGMMQSLSLEDSIEIMAVILPHLSDVAEAKNNINDMGYFSNLEKLYRKIVVDKIKKAEHLWMIYCDTTSYPYMVDDDCVMLYNYKDRETVQNALKKYGYETSVGIETPETFLNEVAHMYRNGYKNIRFTNGKDKEFIVSREEFAPYDLFFRDDYVTNPGLQNAMIKFFQEYRKQGDKSKRLAILGPLEDDMRKAIINAEYMTPCIKEENEDQIEIAHPFIDLTERYGKGEGDEKVLSIPVFSDGYEMDKCFKDIKENMLYKYDELVSMMTEIGASGIIINALGVSHYMPLDSMKNIWR